MTAAPVDDMPPDQASRRIRWRGWRQPRLWLAALLLLLLAAGAGAWLTGVLGPSAGAPAAQPAAPVFFDLPEIITNLNANGRRPAFVRLRAKLELAQPADAAQVQAMLPRVMDLFQTYLRETRPEELRGSAGTHRLREELLLRSNLAVAPARIADILFVEILVQ
jgi:flagellar FliL protein